MFAPVAMPARSPASRRCTSCCKHAEDGVYGPPVLALVGEAGAYESALLSDLWWCLRCGLQEWDRWKRAAPKLEARRQWVREEVARRAAKLETLGLHRRDRMAS